MNLKATLASLVAAAAGVALLYVYMQRFEQETSGGTRVAVLTAAEDIPLGTVLSQDMLGQRMLPQAYLEQRHIRAKDAEQVIGAPVSMTVKAGESLLWSDLATMQADRRELASLVQHGMRALTVTASGESVLIRPGDRVDVLFTGGDQLTVDTVPPSTVTLLQNVLVLAVAGDTGGPREVKKRGARRSSGVTLSLTPEQAQLVAYARSNGRLELVVRNPEDILVLADLPRTSRSDITDAEKRSRFVRRPSVASAAVEIDHVQ